MAYLWQFAAVCGSLLQSVAICCSLAVCYSLWQCAAVCGSLLQYLAVCCSMLQSLAVFGCLWLSVAVCASLWLFMAVFGSLWQGWAGMTFGHLGTGTGMAQPIPKLWEREREWKISFPTFGNGNGKIPFPIFGNGNGNSIPAFREREWDVVIPGNDREWERELHRKIEWKFFIIPLFNPTNFLHCNRPQISS